MSEEDDALWRCGQPAPRHPVYMVAGVLLVVLSAAIVVGIIIVVVRNL